MTPPTEGRIGRYELLELLGGGMSHVYRAKDTTIGRTVALKILTPEGCCDEETRERFLQEARMAGNISHENILNIYDYGEADGRPFLVMEFLQGADLRTLIKDQSAGNTESKLRIALQVARAMEYIHERKIIHRDIKPDNIRIMPTGVVKLMDFGIAKLEGLSRTRAGYVVGTPYYMAPEQVRGGEVTTLVDVYAYGILLFELFSGVKPVVADDIVQVFHLILNEPIDLAPLRHAGTPEPIIQLIERCTAKDPMARPQSFSLIIREIDALLNPSPTVLTPAAQEAFKPKAPVEADTQKAPDQSRKNLRLIAVLCAAVIVIGVAVLLLVRRTSNAAAPPGMVLIPAGTFLSDQNLIHRPLPAFYIDRREVSASDYIAFCKQTACTVPDTLRSADPHNPASDITFDDAQSYARWAGKRLPSFYEWERAARGTDGRVYPWGSKPDGASANMDHRDQGPWPVDRFDGDKSPDGVVNMGGNVSEWVNQTQTPSTFALQMFSGMQPPAAASERWFTMRGGSFALPAQAAETYAFQSLPARFHNPSLGFRCAKDLP